MFKKSSSFVDLTHTLHPHIPTWNGSCGYCESIKKDYDQGLRVQKLQCFAGIGTHIDAPSHFYEGGPNVSDIPLETLFAPIRKIDITHKCSADSKLLLSDIALHEEKCGRLEKGEVVVVHTGWDRYWNDSLAFRNLGSDGIMQFPSIDIKAARLIFERGALGIGIDTLSPDADGSDFPVHQLFLQNRLYIIENIANLGSIPEKGSFGVILPIKASTATEAPIRFVAVMDFS